MRSLVWVDRQGREEPIKAPPRAYFGLRLSPDGTRIALDTRDQENDIWVWDLARQTLTRLTFDPSVDVFPVWTPDGRRIVFSSPRGPSVPNLFWQPADGTGMAERLTTSTVTQYANSFSPDGTRLLLQDGGSVGSAEAASAFDISMMPMDGRGKPAHLIESQFTKRNADISPDSRWVAYEANDSGQFQIYVQPFPNVSTGRWQISTAGGTKPLWARTGHELFYVDGSGVLMTVPIQTTTAFSSGTPAKLIEAKYFSRCTAEPVVRRLARRPALPDDQGRAGRKQSNRHGDTGEPGRRAQLVRRIEAEAAPEVGTTKDTAAGTTKVTKVKTSQRQHVAGRTVMSFTHRRALSLVGILVVLIGGLTAAQTNLPNPYRVADNWAQLPAGMQWAGVISVDPDAKGNIWVFHRRETPILKFDQSGKLLTSFGTGCSCRRTGWRSTATATSG